MSFIPVINNTRGEIGKLHTLEVATDSVLIFQVNRHTKDINGQYLESAKEALRTILPEDKLAVIIGIDVNVYELAGKDAITLKLKGLI